MSCVNTLNGGHMNTLFFFFSSSKLGNKKTGNNGDKIMIALLKIVNE